MDNKSISSDLIRGHIDTIILYSLLDSDKCAQQISDAVESKSENKYQLNQATLYSSLKRLENQKYVSAYWHDSEVGRRRFFKLTDLGTETVKNNLSNWSYSRAIIDKLMDCEPEPIIKTQIIEKKVYVESEKPLEKTIVEPSKILAQQPKNEILSQTHNVVNKTTENRYNTAENKQETNFRAILNGLIKSTEKVKKSDTIVQDVEIKEEENVQKFNETIKKDDLTAKNAVKSNKIDFEDLVEQAQKEGYKLKISSKKREISTGTLLINKTRFISSLAIYLLCLVEFLIISLSAKTVLNTSPVAVIFILLGLTVYPVICGIIFYKRPQKTASKIKKDSILTAGIIVFNLILLVVVMNLLCNVDFNNTFSLITAFLTPSILCFNVFIYYVIKYFVSTTKTATVKGKK